VNFRDSELDKTLVQLNEETANRRIPPAIGGLKCLGVAVALLRLRCVPVSLY
jgi:hypothetical protein